MLEYILSSCVPQSTSDVLDWGFVGNGIITLNKEGVLHTADVPYAIPELILSLATRSDGIYAISTEGSVYSIDTPFIAKKESFPEPIVSIEHYWYRSFATSEAGNTYYSYRSGEWCLIKGISKITKIVPDPNTIYLFSNGWYNLLTNDAGKCSAVKLGDNVQDIMVDGNRIAMIVDGERYYV